MEIAPLLLPFLIVLCRFLLISCQELCEINGSESVIILDILESLGNQINQSTIPSELPIRGRENQIKLSIQSSTKDYFNLVGKKLQLKRPLDRDEEKLTMIRLSVLCRQLSSPIQRNIPVVVRVSDINDNVPEFRASSYSTSVSELAPVGTTIFRDLMATDKDSDSNGLVEYFTVPGNSGENDGFSNFAINLPYQGLVTVKKNLDFEKVQLYYLSILAMDKGDPRLSSTNTLTIHVVDGDDQDPTFIYKGCTLVNNACVNAEYLADVTSGASTVILNVKPENIKAKDRDSLNAPIMYSFANGTPPFYAHYFRIDPLSGQVHQTNVVDRSLTKRFDIIVKAEEKSESQRFTTAKLTIEVQAVDNNPPIIVSSAMEGYVDENSPVGTTIMTAKGGSSPLRLFVSDADIALDDPPVDYTFELTTNSFRVNADGILVVNEVDLDRDPPNPEKYTFQVIARQLNTAPGKGASAPISLSVHLNDINDNSPKLPSLTPVRIQAGEGVRTVTQVQARDNDAGDFAKIIYSIYHVSNNGQSKFRIDRENGIVEVVEKVRAGEQYSITVQATDSGGRFTQSILDVIIVPGPNTGGPVFAREKYDVQVSEGASVTSAVITVMAEDPERDRVFYSIIDGNINGDFAIDSRSGTISLAKRLDREEVSAYSLIVKAEDPSGLFSTAIVSITVTDINDQNPVFLDDYYNFRVDEGVVNALVGAVQARDDDISLNGEVYYSISSNNDFDINSKTGEIFTRKALDYERQQVHFLVVSAKDRAPDARFATASVTVYVNDIQDEKPIFEKSSYEGVVPENTANFDVVQVKATDPDSVSSITYIIKEGDSRLFAIDPVTGMIRTLRGLDYELHSSYTLLVGTLENDEPDQHSMCTVTVIIQDKNDIPPVFTSVPLPIRLQDTVPLGTVVTTVVASDADGTPPGNQVKYEISGRDKSPYYFLIDSNTGVLSVKDDLRKEPDSEYRIEVKAHDLGNPPLSATATVTVYVEHIATVPPDSGLGFADSSYTVEVEENSLANTLVKVLPIINKPRGNFPIGCEIASGNDEGHFYVTENELRDCELRTQDQGLDYEEQPKYSLVIRLITVGGLFGSSRLVTQVAVNIVDLNDNRPVFLIPPRYSRLSAERYIGAIPYDSPAGTSFLQVMATDRDSAYNGKVVYEILQESDPKGLFKIDTTSGTLSNSKILEDVSNEELPLKLQVVARDSPELRSAVLMESTEVLVNLISDENRMILAIKDSVPDKVLDMKDSILRLLQDRTGMIADLEKVVSLKLMKNNTIETDTSGSDLWFYVIDPGTMGILTSDDPKIRLTMFDNNVQAGILSDVSRILQAQAEKVRLPYVPMQPSGASTVIVNYSGIHPAKTEMDVSDLGAALIALAAIIVILGIVGIIYHCCMWSRYVAYRERLKRLYVAPRYEPVFVEQNLKEYETQVLQMSVPMDEDHSIPDAHLSLRLQGLENIAYITRDKGDGTASAFGGRTSASESSPYNKDSPEGQSSLGNTTARASSTLSANTAVLDEEGMMTPARNPLYDEFQEDEDGLPVSKPNDAKDGVALVETHQPRSSKPHNKHPYSYDKHTVENTTEL